MPERVSARWELEREPDHEGPWKVPVANPIITDTEKQAVADCLDQGWISGRSQIVATAEAMFAEKVGARHAVACNSGGSALLLMLLADGIGPGHRVLVPSFTMVATGAAVVQSGATPVFCDCDSRTLCARDWKRDAVEFACDAVVGVHIYGHPFGAEHDPDINVYADAAEAHGAKPVFEDCLRAAAFGFYANKTVTCGEGGMVATNDDAIAEKARRLRDYHFDPRFHFWHTATGYSMRMPAMSAAFLTAQIRRWDQLVESRRVVAQRYHDMLEGYRHGRCTELPGYTNSYWHYWARSHDRKAIRQKLADAGIETRPGFVPLHVLPAFEGCETAGMCSRSEAAGREVVLLPTYPGVEEYQEEICEILMKG